MIRSGSRSPHLERRGAAASWLCAGIFYLSAEAVTASRFSPPYSYARNYISDLGVGTCGQVFDGRAICSPLHVLMNTSFIVQGGLFLLAALAAARSLTSRARYAFIALAAAHCLGLTLVGLFQEAGQTETVRVHALGAFLAIVGGNATAFASAFLSPELGMPYLHRRASFVLSIMGVGALTMLVVAQSRGTMLLLPNGVWERASVYTITIWEVLTAACLAGGPVPPRHSSPCGH